MLTHLIILKEKQFKTVSTYTLMAVTAVFNPLALELDI